MAKYSIIGTLIKTGTAGGSPSSTIGQVVSGEADFGTRNLIDSTTVNDTTETNDAGNMTPLSINATVQWDPADTGAAAAMTAFLAGTLISGGVFYRGDGVGSGTPSIYSDGRWTNVTAPIAVNGMMQATFVFSGSGDVTYAA